MKKQLVISLLAFGTIGLTSIRPVSADVISNTDGVTFIKNTSITPTYTLVVGQLSSDDWSLDVSETEAPDDDTTNVSKSQEVHGLTLTPAGKSQKVSQIVLTDAGIEKVKDLTGVSSSSNMNIVARFKKDDKMYVGNMFDDDNVNATSPIVYVTKTTRSKTVSSNKAIKTDIEDVTKLQTEQQKKLHVLTADEKETMNDSNIPLITGVDISTKHLSTEKINQKSGSDQKDVQKVLMAEKKQKNQQTLWHGLGYVLLVGFGFITGYIAYKVTKKLKNKG